MRCFLSRSFFETLRRIANIVNSEFLPTFFQHCFMNVQKSRKTDGIEFPKAACTELLKDAVKKNQNETTVKES